MSLGDRLNAAGTDSYAPIPKGVYPGVLNKVEYRAANGDFSESVNLEFVLTKGEYEGRKVWCSCYTFEPKAGQKDPIWKLAKNLSALGLKLDTFQTVQEAAAAMESTGLHKTVDVEVTAWKKSDGTVKNDGFVKTLVDEVAGADDVDF